MTTNAAGWAGRRLARALADWAVGMGAIGERGSMGGCVSGGHLRSPVLAAR
jgi:hypothetical protein